MKTIGVALLVAGSLAGLYAQKNTTIHISRENDLPVIKTQKGFTTLIEFPTGEEISEVTCGDKDFWVIEGKGRYLSVKPAKEGSSTNVNIVLKSDAVYSFMLREAKSSPDLVVSINGGDELTNLRKERDNLEESLSRSEKAVKELSDKLAQPKKPEVKKEGPPVRNKKEEEPAPVEVPAVASLLPAGPVKSAPPPPAAVPEQASPPSQEGTADFRSYTIERHDGLLRKSGRFFAGMWRKVNKALHIY